MPRVKRGTIGLKKRRRLLKRAKGFRFGRGNKEREARTALLHAGLHAFAHRRDKKNNFRRLWHVQLNAVLRPNNLTYSRFVNQLKKRRINLNRKMLVELAQYHPEIFSKLIKTTTPDTIIKSAA